MNLKNFKIHKPVQLCLIQNRIHTLRKRLNEQALFATSYSDPTLVSISEELDAEILEYMLEQKKLYQNNNLEEKIS